QVPRDLETICLTALAKDPARRYPGAGELGLDLGRFLAGEPVRVRPPGALRRWWLWARRRPALAAVYGLLAALGVLGAAGGGAGWQWRQAEQARDQAEGARAEAEHVRDQLGGAKDELGRVLYFRQVALALTEWRENEAARARRLLAGCPPALRGWEGHYAHRACHPQPLGLPHLKGGSGGCLHPHRKRLAHDGLDADR